MSEFMSVHASDIWSFGIFLAIIKNQNNHYVLLHTDMHTHTHTHTHPHTHTHHITWQIRSSTNRKAKHKWGKIHQRLNCSVQQSQPNENVVIQEIYLMGLYFIHYPKNIFLNLVGLHKVQQFTILSQVAYIEYYCKVQFSDSKCRMSFTLV